MKIKKKYLLFVLFLIIESYSQNNSRFHFDNIGDYSKFILIDDLSYLDLNFENEISYNELKSVTSYLDGSYAIDIKDTLSNRFFFYKKMMIDDNKSIVIYHESKTNFGNYNYFYQLLFNSKNQFVNLQRIGLRSTDSLMSSSNSLLCENYFFVWNFNIHSNQLDSLFFMFNYNKPLLFDNYECNEIDFCLNYTPNLESLPERNLSKYIFDSTFFTNIINLIPLKYCSTILNTKVLTSIGNKNFELKENYFVESKKISSTKRIVFSLNEYLNIENYKNVKEIVYHIIDNNNVVIKSEQIALCYILDNKEYIKWSKVNFSENFIEITSSCYGCETRIEKIHFE